MDPLLTAYRSPLHRKLEALGTEFMEINGYAVPDVVAGFTARPFAPEQLALCDMSGLPRVGVKGANAVDWLTEKGFLIPANSNSALRQSDGVLLACLAPNEFLLLGEESSSYPSIENLVQQDKFPRKTKDQGKPFLVPRQHSQIWFRLTGCNSVDMLAKLCAIDFRDSNFKMLQVAQTSVARLNAIILREDLGGSNAFHILADRGSAEYLWDCILDAGEEYEIQVVGLKLLAELKQG